MWPIDSCQNRVSADQYHLTVTRAQMSTHRGQVFFEVIRWQVTCFQMIAGSSLIFLKFIWNMSWISAAKLKFWFQTDLGRKNSASYCRRGRQVLLTLLTMITRWSGSSSNFYAVIRQNLTGEFMRKIYAASWTCLLWQLKLTEFMRGDYRQNEMLYYAILLFSFRLHNWCYVLSIWHYKFHSSILYFVMYWHILLCTSNSTWQY